MPAGLIGGDLTGISNQVGCVPEIGRAETTRRLEAMLERLRVHVGEPGKPKRRGRARNAPCFDVRTALYRTCGVDLTRIEGIDATTALKVISEIGPDVRRFKTAKNFASWLGLCPGTRISGGKRLSGASKRTANRAAQALRIAADVAHSQPVGARRLLSAAV